MNINERREIYCHSMTAETPFCENCKYFKQHYGVSGDGKRYTKLASGHCTEPRMKPRRAYDTCERFEMRNRDRR